MLALKTQGLNQQAGSQFVLSNLESVSLYAKLNKGQSLCIAVNESISMEIKPRDIILLA